MANPFENESVENYSVLVNAEGQHSVWPAFREPPEGWMITGPVGKWQLCLDWIDAHWIEMQPEIPLTPSN